MIEYYMPSHVHCSIDADAAVFLDLRTDQYHMLLGAKARAFENLLSRAPDLLRRTIRLDCPASKDDQTVTSTMVIELLDNNLLTLETPDRPSAPPTRIPTPDRNLIDAEAPDPTYMRKSDILRLFVSCLIAKFRLKWTTIESVVSAVERRNRSGATVPLDLGKARNLVRIYRKLRPLLPMEFTCLDDSLSLLEFLARYHCFPHWVFAIQLEPWAAHCWVQYDSVTFNEDNDVARTYLPVLVV